MSAYVSARTPKWARVKGEEDDESRPAKRTKKGRKNKPEVKAEEADEEELSTMEALEEMTRSTGKYITKPKMLPKLHLNSTLLKDVTVGHNRSGTIKTIKFHPWKEVMITGSGQGRISLFELCREDMSLEMKKGDFFLQDVQFEGFHLDSMEFFNEGRALIAHAANRKYCMTYDLMEGKVSEIHLPFVLRDFKSTKMAVSADGVHVAHVMGGSDLYVFLLSTMEHLHTFRAGSQLVDVCFLPSDRNRIYAVAQNGAIYEWDLSRRAEQSYFFDDGCVQATCSALSPNGQFIACGSNTGIVNVYEMSSVLGQQSSSAKREDDESGEDDGPTWGGGAKDPKPLYTLTNLTTSALFLRFNCDAQMMAFGSSVKFMAGRMLHCRSGDVFQNFPKRHEMFEKERVKCAEFSPSSAFFAMGMESGGTRLYRLHHFDHY